MSKALTHLTAIILTIIITSVFAQPLYLPIVTFNTGRISPHMEARTDYQKYQSSCRQLENMLITSQGPVKKRPGTAYISDANDVTYTTVRLLPFEYSTDDTYILEFSHDTTDPNGLLRFYRNGAQIEAP